MALSTAELNQTCFKYILNAIPEPSEIAGGWDIKEPENDTERLKFVLDTFRSEKQYHIDQIGQYKAFQEWLMGLPSALNVDFENYRIIEIAKEWGSIPQDADDRQEYKILNNWFNLITNKFFQLCKRHKIDIN